MVVREKGFPQDDERAATFAMGQAEFSVRNLFQPNHFDETGDCICGGRVGARMVSRPHVERSCSFRVSQLDRLERLNGALRLQSFDPPPPRPPALFVSCVSRVGCCFCCLSLIRGLMPLHGPSVVGRYG